MIPLVSFIRREEGRIVERKRDCLLVPLVSFMRRDKRGRKNRRDDERLLILRFRREK